MNKKAKECLLQWLTRISDEPRREVDCVGIVPGRILDNYTTTDEGDQLLNSSGKELLM